jgi:hypothetical protein
MNPLYITGTDECPDVILDKENTVFRFSGKSLPENVIEFYSPIVQWLKEYAEDPLEKTVLEISLYYFNTASSKMLLDIFTILENMNNQGKKTSIDWYYPEYDDEMKEAGIEYSEIVDIEFNFLVEEE